MEQALFLFSRPEEARPSLNAMGNVQCCAGGAPRSKLPQIKRGRGRGRVGSQEAKPYQKKPAAAAGAGSVAAAAPGRTMRRCELQTAVEATQDWLEQCLAELGRLRRTSLTTAGAVDQASLRDLSDELQLRRESVERLLLCCHDYLDANDYKDVAFDVDVGTLERAWKSFQLSLQRMGKLGNGRVQPLPGGASVVQQFDASDVSAGSPNKEPSESPADGEKMAAAAAVFDRPHSGRRSSAARPKSRGCFHSSSGGSSGGGSGGSSSPGRKYVAHLTWQYRAVIRNASQLKCKPRSSLSLSASESSSLALSDSGGGRCADGKSPPTVRGHASSGRTAHSHRGEGAEKDLRWSAEDGRSIRSPQPPKPPARRGRSETAQQQQQCSTVPGVPHSRAFHERLDAALAWADGEAGELEEEEEEKSGSALDLGSPPSTEPEDPECRSCGECRRSGNAGSAGSALKRSRGVHEELSSFALPSPHPVPPVVVHQQPVTACEDYSKTCCLLVGSKSTLVDGLQSASYSEPQLSEERSHAGTAGAGGNNWSQDGVCCVRAVDLGKEDRLNQRMMECDARDSVESCAFKEEHESAYGTATLIQISKDVKAVDDFLQHYKAVLSWLADVKCFAEHRATSISEQHLSCIYHMELSDQNSARWQAMEIRRLHLVELQPELLQEVDQRLCRLRIVRDQLKSDLSEKVQTCSFEKMAADAHHELDILTIQLQQLETTLSCSAALLDGDLVAVDGLDDQLHELRAEQDKAEECSRTASIILRLSRHLQALLGRASHRTASAAALAVDLAVDDGDGLCRPSALELLREDLEAVEEEAARILERWQTVWLQTVEQQSSIEEAAAARKQQQQLVLLHDQQQINSSHTGSPSLDSLLSSSPDQTATNDAAFLHASSSSSSSCSDEDDGADERMTEDCSMAAALRTGRGPPLCTPEASTLTLQLLTGSSSGSGERLAATPNGSALQCASDPELARSAAGGQRHGPAVARCPAGSLSLSSCHAHGHLGSRAGSCSGGGSSSLGDNAAAAVAVTMEAMASSTSYAASPAADDRPVSSAANSVAGHLLDGRLIERPIDNPLECTMRGNVLDGQHHRTDEPASSWMMMTTRTTTGHSVGKADVHAVHAVHDDHVAYRPQSVTSDYSSAACESLGSSMHEESKSLLLMTSCSVAADCELLSSSSLLSPELAAATHWRSPPRSPGYDDERVADFRPDKVVPRSSADRMSNPESFVPGKMGVSTCSRGGSEQRKAAAPSAIGSLPTSPYDLSYETSLLSHRSRSFHTVESRADPNGNYRYSETVHISRTSSSELGTVDTERSSGIGSSRQAADALGIGRMRPERHPLGMALKRNDSCLKSSSSEHSISGDCSNIRSWLAEGPRAGTYDMAGTTLPLSQAPVARADSGLCDVESPAEADGAAASDVIFSSILPGNQSQQLLGRLQLQFAPIDCKASATQHYLSSRSRHRRTAAGAKCRSEARLWMSRPRGRCFSAATSMALTGESSSSGSLASTLSAPALSDLAMPTKVIGCTMSSCSSNASTSQSGFSNCFEDDDSSEASLSATGISPSSSTAAQASLSKLDQQSYSDVSGRSPEVATDGIICLGEGSEESGRQITLNLRSYDDASDCTIPSLHMSSLLASADKHSGDSSADRGQCNVIGNGRQPRPDKIFEASNNPRLTSSDGNGNGGLPSDLVFREGHSPGTTWANEELPGKHRVSALEPAPEHRQLTDDARFPHEITASAAGCATANETWAGPYLRQVAEQVIAYQLNDGSLDSQPTAVSLAPGAHCSTEWNTTGSCSQVAENPVASAPKSARIVEAAGVLPMAIEQSILQFGGSMLDLAALENNVEATVITILGDDAERASSAQLAMASLRDGGSRPPYAQLETCCVLDSDDDSLCMGRQSSGRASVDSIKLCGSDDSSSCCSAEIGAKPVQHATSSSRLQRRLAVAADPDHNGCGCRGSSSSDTDDWNYTPIVCLSQSVPSIPLVSTGRPFAHLRRHPADKRQRELSFLDYTWNPPCRSERESSVETLKAAEDTEAHTAQRHVQRDMHCRELACSRRRVAKPWRKRKRESSRRKQPLLLSEAALPTADECALTALQSDYGGLDESAANVAGLDSLSTHAETNSQTSATTGTCESSDDTDELLQPSSFSETAWDSYQERYNTSDLEVEEPASTTSDVAVTYPFLCWDDDLSPGAEADDPARVPVAAIEESNAFPTSHAATVGGSGSMQENSDSDLDDLQDVLSQSSRQLIVMECTVKKAADGYEKPGLAVPDLAEYDQWLATCQTNLKCLKAISDHLDGGPDTSATPGPACSSSRRSLHDLVVNWQRLEIRASDVRRSAAGHHAALQLVVEASRLAALVRHREDEADRLLAACSSLDDVDAARAHLVALKVCRKMLSKLNVPSGANAMDDHVHRALSRVNDDKYQCENRLRSRIRHLTNYLRLWQNFEENRKDLEYVIQQFNPISATRPGFAFGDLPTTTRPAAELHLGPGEEPAFAEPLPDVRDRLLQLLSQARTLSAAGVEAVSDSWSSRSLAAAARLVGEIEKLGVPADEDPDFGHQAGVASDRDAADRFVGGFKDCGVTGNGDEDVGIANGVVADCGTTDGGASDCGVTEGSVADQDLVDGVEDLGVENEGVASDSVESGGVTGRSLADGGVLGIEEEGVSDCGVADGYVAVAEAANDDFADCPLNKATSESTELTAAAAAAARAVAVCDGGCRRRRVALRATVAAIWSFALVGLLLALYLQPVCCDYSGAGGIWGLSKDYVNGLPPT